MDQILLDQLNSRNDRILKAVLIKAKKICPNSIAFIGITGSFLEGVMHEKSDLDLFIVTNDDDGYKIASCFIIDDVAFDVYCYTWDKIEEMAKYTDPFVSKLLDMKFVYCSDDRYMERYMNLRIKLLETMDSPFDLNDFNKVKKHWEMGMQSYAKVMMDDDYHTCKSASYFVMYYIQFVIYMLNKSYVKKGVRFIPEEICGMEKLPFQFNQYYFDLLKADTLDDVKSSATSLMNNVKKFLEEVEHTLIQKECLNSNVLIGTYEEIISNYKNKMRLATQKNDVYQAFTTACSCQDFYDDMYRRYDMKKINLMAHFDINNLSLSEKAFDDALQEYESLYLETNTKIVQYDNVDDFEKNYLK